VDSLVQLFQEERDTRRRAFTVRKDLTAICALHAEIHSITKVRHYHESSGELTDAQNMDDIDPPQFPDPFLIGNTEEEYLRIVKNASRKHTYTHTYSFTSARELGKTKSGHGCNPMQTPDARPLQQVIQRLQDYLQGIFALMETVDPALGGTGQGAILRLNFTRIRVPAIQVPERCQRRWAVRRPISSWVMTLSLRYLSNSAASDKRHSS
jgi:hypothetical protein